MNSTGSALNERYAEVLPEILKLLQNGDRTLKAILKMEFPDIDYVLFRKYFNRKGFYVHKNKSFYRPLGTNTTTLHIVLDKMEWLDFKQKVKEKNISQFYTEIIREFIRNYS